MDRFWSSVQAMAHGDWSEVDRSEIAAVGLAVVIGAAALWCLWWLWWRLPKRQVACLSLMIRDAKARAEIEDSFRKTIGQLLGGAAVLVGAGFAYLQLVPS